MLKCLTIFVALLLSDTAFASDFSCFASGEAYMTAKFGSAYRDDENLKIKKQRYGRQDYLLASDTTSGTNSPITLLLQQPGKGLCEVLSTPPVATLKASKYDEHGRPIAFFAKDQGTTSREITYKWDSSSNHFRADSCKEVTWVKDKSASRAVACESVLQ